MAYTTNCTILPTFHPHTMFFSPLCGELTGEGLMQNSRFAGFKAVQRVLGLLFGLIQLGKQTFNAVNDALLLVSWRKRNRRFGNITCFNVININPRRKIAYPVTI